MEAVQRLVRSLKSARSYELPDDPKAAYFMLLSPIMQNHHREFIDLLSTSSTFDINFASGKSKRTLLHMAANVGAYECLCHLLKKGAVPNVADRQGITPLQVASRNGYTRCIMKLLENGSDLEIKNNEGMTAIHWLAANGRTEVFTEITKFISNIDVEDENYQTPLHVACMNGHISTVRKLIELKANLEKKSAHGCTPLLYACRHGHSEVTKELIEHKANFTCNNEGESPLDVAVKGGHGGVCFILITHSPELLPKLISACLAQDLEDHKVKSVLSFVISQNIFYRNRILNDFASVLQTEGLKLLSQSSDYEKTSDHFLYIVKIFIYLLEYNPKQITESSRSRIPSNAGRFHSDTLCEQYCSPPANNCEINTGLNELWRTMENWMEVLKNELQSKENSCGNQEKTGSKSFVSHLRKSTTLLRQASKTSASYDLLRAMQPAAEINFNEGVNLEETLDTSQGYRRSYSYETAVSSLSNDFERALSPSLAQNELSNEHHVPGSRVSLSANQSLPGTVNERVQCKLDSEGSFDLTNEVLTDSRVFEITADRLCIIVHGYFLFCNAKPVWDRMRKKEKSKEFNSFIEKNEDVFQVLILRKPQLIFQHFSFVLDNPIMFQRFLPAIHTQPFVDRQKWFYERLLKDESTPNFHFDESAVIHVVRESLLQTSCKELTNKNQDLLKKNVAVRFQGEDGMGAGVTREWLDLLVKEMLNPDFALFTLSADGSTFQPNSNSSINPDHLSYFQFAGRVMGLSLYHKHLITAYFTRSFYKHILGIPVGYQDVESIDPEYTKNLQWILDNSIDSLELGLTFSVETNVFGENRLIELKPNGSEIGVDDNNKFEYVNLAADLRMTKAIKPQILAFLKGFYEYIPHHLASLFNEYELELLLSGVPEIDLEDWLSNTAYQAGFTKEDRTITWFWEVVRELTTEEQIQLLQFVTGTSRVPWGGFSNLPGATGNQLFTICRTEGRLLPTASTCFNMLKLPDYETKEELKEKLKIAISCGNAGFEFT